MRNSKKLLGSGFVGSMVNNGNSQRVVSVDDVEEFLWRGWSFVAKLSDEKAVLKLD